MKIVTIFGGPRKNGKTADALKLFEEGIRAKGNEVERVNIIDYKINGCIGCHACMAKRDEPGCVQKDDLMIVFEKMFQADAIVISTPVYTYDYPAQLKPFVDRHFCLLGKSFLNGKKMALLTTCGGPEEGNADLLKKSFQRSFGPENDIFHTELVGTYVIPYSSAPDYNERAVEVVNQLIQEL